MNTSSLFALLFAGCLMAGGIALTPAYADDKAADWADNNTGLSAAQVLQKLDAAGYRQVEKIKRKRDNYEVRTTGRDGERIKLYVNAQTGDILGKRDSDKASRNPSSMVQKLVGNCNARRCRDDIEPAVATSTKP